MVSRLLLEYDGSAFAGWASQPGLRTVQGEVERALSVLLRRSDPALTVAGRTDAGVHAWGQVASYEGPVVPVSGLNALLPEDVAVLSCAEAPDGWSARFDATSRAYCYRVLARDSRSAFWRGRALWWPHDVDLSALQECACALVGLHDFTAFTPTETDHVRFERNVLASFWRRSEADPDLLEFWIEADAFMRHMNRVLVGTMLEVASGRRPLGFSGRGSVGASERGGLGSSGRGSVDASERGGLGSSGRGSVDASERGGLGSSGRAGLGSSGRGSVGASGRGGLGSSGRGSVGASERGGLGSSWRGSQVSSERQPLSPFRDLLAGQPRSAAGATAPACGLYLAGVGYDGERVLDGE